MSATPDFGFLTDADIRDVSRVLADETPTVAAVALSRMDRLDAAKALADFPKDRQREIVVAMREARSLDNRTLADVAEGLRRKLFPRGGPGAAPSGETVEYGGPEAAAAILKYAGPDVHRNIEAEAPELYGSLKRLMFTFDDVLNAPDRSLRIVFAEVVPRTIALALKTAPPGARTRVLDNVSARKAEIIRDELDHMGRVRLRDVEAAQTEILQLGLDLQERGRVVLDDTDDLV